MCSCTPVIHTIRIKKERQRPCCAELWIEQRGRTSVQVLFEYYATVTRKLKPGLPLEDAWQATGRADGRG
jgi:hypothetical protein